MHGWKLFSRKPRDPSDIRFFQEADRSEKARCHNADMHVAGESDGSIVPEKRTNKAGTPVAEFVEERGPPEGMLCGFALISDPAPSL